MRAAPFFEHGGPNVIQYQESFPNPVPKPDEIVVDVDYCGINHLDIWTRQGISGKKIRLPHLCGCDIVGHIENKAGTRKSKSTQKRRTVIVYPGISCHACVYCKSGRENLCSKFSILGGMSDHDGGYAEQVAVPSSNIVDLPASLDPQIAVTLPVSYLTAWNMLTTNIVGKSTSLLVYGGASGVGMACIQLAKALGASPVITTASTKNKKIFSSQLGADYVVDTSSDISSEVLKITGGKGVDIVVDHVGASTWKTSIASLRQGGKMAVCGMTSGNDAVVPIRTFYTKQIIMTGALLGTKAQFKELLKFVERKKIRPCTDSTLSLEEARKAQERMEDGKHQGKILLDVARH